MLEEMLGWEKRALIGRSRGVHNWYRKALTKKEFERTPVNRHERLLTRVTTRYILSVLSYSRSRRSGANWKCLSMLSISRASASESLRYGSFSRIRDAS
jgi:hypothetical protein